jgi:hypothetical protein
MAKQDNTLLYIGIGVLAYMFLTKSSNANTSTVTTTTPGTTVKLPTTTQTASTSGGSNTLNTVLSNLPAITSTVKSIFAPDYSASSSNTTSDPVLIANNNGYSDYTGGILDWSYLNEA